ncbi:MAG TPA: DUF3108 domain-containing protein [Bacteroidales bacterium]|nr:DUF3108 domain-containing protein [Bacteroidales bacterium]
MIRKFLITCIFLILTLTSGFSQQIKTYKPGEKLEYIIHYGIINGGTASLEINRDTLFRREVWHSKMIARTTGFTDALFRVVDIYESYIDPATELPVKSIRNIREGRYRKYNEVLFDHKTRRDSAILTSDLTGVHITQPGIHDILSCFYHLRDNILPDSDLKKGEMITIMTWFTDELYPIRLRYLGIDEVKTRFGKIKCHKFNPVTETGRLFSTEEGVSFWFSADKNFLPVMIRFDIFVGSFTIELAEFEGLANQIDFKKK